MLFILTALWKKKKKWKISKIESPDIQCCDLRNWANAGQLFEWHKKCRNQSESELWKYIVGGAVKLTNKNHFFLK